MKKHIYIFYQPIDSKQDITSLNAQPEEHSFCVEQIFNSKSFTLHHFTLNENQIESIMAANPSEYEKKIEETLETLFAAANQYPDDDKLVLLHAGQSERLSVKNNDLTKYPKHYTFSGGTEVGDKLINTGGIFLPRNPTPTVEDLENALHHIWEKYNVIDYSFNFFKEL